MAQKKYLILLICKILETETDEQHPLTQIKIAEIISDVYPCDRKTVGRNIRFLQKMGYPIVKTINGFYMSKKVFSVADVEFIRQAVLSSDERTDSEKAELLKKLLPVLQKAYRR